MSPSAAPAMAPPASGSGEKVMALLGTWGRPPDTAAWVALGLAVLLLVGAASSTSDGFMARWLAPHEAWRRPARTIGRRRFLVVTSFVAAFLSLGYVEHYLRGGPRIIDATMYFLQGRALAHGDLTWHVVDPTASFRGRFLLFHEPDVLGGIFPPGYPLLLALGFLIGAPMVIGPLLAAAIACATYLLVHELARDAAGGHGPGARETLARFGALFSLGCAALRYHTADTMSHGACALALTLGLTALLHARRTGRLRSFGLAGLAAGYVVATRIPSSFALGALLIGMAFVVTPRREGPKRLAVVALGALPGVLLLLLAQARVAGDALLPTQTAYYAASDGPPGCFRYGFGAGVGCLYEHGDFVRARLADGFGFTAAAGTTLRRLWMHLLDVTNWEPFTVFFLAIVVPLLRRERTSRLAALLVVGQIAAYVPFYFDGNYPGGGARLFADVLPVEHALFVLALARVRPDVAFARRAALALAAALFGFAVHGVFAHRALAARDGGRPAYEPDLVREARQDFGLLYFDTDAGFDLAYDPEVTSSHGVMAVRRRDDDRDRILYDAMGHPAASLYRFHDDGRPSTVEPFIPAPHAAGTWRFEAEGDWPPIAQRGGYALPAWASGAGVSNDRLLELTAVGDGPASADLELPVPPESPSDAARATPPVRRFSVRPRVVLVGSGARGALVVYRPSEGKTGSRGDAPGQGVELARWTWVDPWMPTPVHLPRDLDPRAVGILSGPVRIRLVVEGPAASGAGKNAGAAPGPRAGGGGVGGESAAAEGPQSRPLQVALDKTTLSLQR